ncbi:MAG TPA: hypothetical protein VMP03_02475 [Methylomirabilota bacterium]|nr:hypothetical protein [Methylomirabilota bacterium]
MSPLKTIIAEAVSRYPLKTMPEWARVCASADVDIERIEADCATISTVDCLFDGEATVFLSDARELPVQVFGRFDGRRAEVERIVVAE